MGRLEGHRVLVTGASSGIGAATARAAAAEGARVALLARRAETVTALAGELGGVAVPADVTDEAAVGAAVDRAGDALGGLDGVVAAAGAMTLGSVADTDVAVWRTIVEVNVLGVLATARAALPWLGDGATVVLVSSLSGRRVPSAAGGVYAASKHAVHAVGETLRGEVGPRGVRVTTLAPGFVATDLVAGETDRPDVAEFARRMREQGLTPEAVADAAVHLLALPPEVTVVEYALRSTRQG